MRIIQLHDGSVLGLEDDKSLTKLDNPSGHTTTIKLKEVDTAPGKVIVDGKQVHPQADD